MRLASLASKQGSCIGVVVAERGLVDLNAAWPELETRDVGSFVRSGAFERQRHRIEATAKNARAVLDPQEIEYRPLLAPGGKVLCLGLNYVDHAAESKNPKPEYPVVFGRYPSSFVGHERPLAYPKVSEHFDYESELAVMIGRGGRAIPRERALEHVAGYTLMNDGSVRDYQVRTSQWMIGKNFDASGALGPELVTADGLPPGARGLGIEGRLNGAVMQSANTSDMIFDVETTIALLSEVMTLEAGDVIALGTPSGVGFARTPPVFLKPGDVFEVTVERVGTLRNPIR